VVSSGADDSDDDNEGEYEDVGSPQPNQTIVQLSGVPTSVDDEFLKMFLENKKRGSLNVVNVKFCTDGIALVELGSEDGNAIVT